MDSFKILVFIVFILFTMLIASLIFIGLGYIISLALPLTLFQSSIICIAAFFLTVFVIFKVEEENKFYHLFNDEYLDDVTEPEEYENNLGKRFTIITDAKAKRNEPCPCGSGKRFKNCCGRKGK